MIAASKIDAFGFSEAASVIHTRLIDTANRVGFSITRSAALLRSLHFQLLNANPREVNIHDVEALVALALSALPDPDGEAFETFEECGSEASQTVRAMQEQQRALSALLDAMETAARMEATLEELDEAANAAYGIVSTLPDGQRHWDAFCELIVRRGLSLELLEVVPGVRSYLKVNTPETLAHSQAAQNKMAAFVTAAHEESAARTSQSKPAKRRKGKV